MKMQEGLVNLDRALALERVGGDECLLREIAALFLEEYPLLVAEIQAAVVAGDASGVERAAHTLKGSVGNFSSGAAFQAALRLEMIGRSRDLSAAGAAFDTLRLALDLLTPELTSLTACL